MGSSRCTVRVMRVVAAICVGVAMTGQVVAYADPAPNPDSSSDQKPSSRFGDKPSSRSGDKPFSRSGDKPSSSSEPTAFPAPENRGARSTHPTPTSRSHPRGSQVLTPSHLPTTRMNCPKRDGPNSGSLTPATVDDPSKERPTQARSPRQMCPPRPQRARTRPVRKRMLLPTTSSVDYDKPKGSDWPPPTPDVKVPPPPPPSIGATHRRSRVSSTNHRRSRRPSHPNRRRRSSWRAR